MRICKKTLKQRGKDADAMKIDERASTVECEVKFDFTSFYIRRIEMPDCFLSATMISIFLQMSEENEVSALRPEVQQRGWGAAHSHLSENVFQWWPAEEGRRHAVRRRIRWHEQPRLRERCAATAMDACLCPVLFVQVSRTGDAGNGHDGGDAGGG